jgi:hypothetical protein
MEAGDAAIGHPVRREFIHIDFVLRLPADHRGVIGPETPKKLDQPFSD